MGERVITIGPRNFVTSEQWRGLTWLLLPALLLLVFLAIAPEVQAGNVDSADGNGYQGADYWRDVKQGVSGYSTNKDAEAGVLVNQSGESWRQLRNNEVKPKGGWALAITVLVLLAAYVVLGGSKLEQPRSGLTVERWKRFDRCLHWLVAGLFIVLAITGLSLLYGRHFLPDLLGASAFGTLLQGGKIVHNYLGPLFMLSLGLMIIKWLKNNIVNFTDLKWFAQGGGMIKGKHPHAGYMNGGEKMWFWVLTFGGVAVCVSGLVLDFPSYFDLRNDFQLANLVHSIASLVLICGALAHAYIGTLGTEGALEGMVSGQVDENWAKQHHDLWYQEVSGQGKTDKTNS